MAVMQILQKRGVRAPVPEEIEVGEVAINTAAGKLYVKTDAGEVVAVGGGDSGTGTGSAVTISETAPLDPSNGDEWLCSEEGQEALYIFDGEVWFGVPIGGQADDGNQNIDGGSAGAIYILDQIIDGGSA